ncbi:hypothetical protein V5O48_017975 [Marasmius crinis-equi]|uniref:Major facilitator superfamily (MFS) profile domain-containing protein n=1 Tax=Marasmius crinis-equi TaxID=585013 RepID=A0ABR3EMN2_9AGAR
MDGSEETLAMPPPAKKPYFGMTGTILNAWVTVACYDQGVFGGIIITESFLQLMGNPGASCESTRNDRLAVRHRMGLETGSSAAYPSGLHLTPLQHQYRDRTSLAERNVQAFYEGKADRVFDDVGVANLLVRHFWNLNFRSMNIAGFSLSNWMTYAFSFVSSNSSWRFPIAFQFVFSIILLSTAPWLPESPRWLLAHGREAEGVAVLVALEGENATAKDPQIVEQKMSILEAVRIESEYAPAWSDILKGNTGNTGMIKRLALGAGTQWMQQLVGINVTSYYLPLVLEDSVGLSSSLSRLLAACNSVSYLVFSFAGLILIERAGRRKLMMWGAAGQCVCYVLIAGLLSQQHTASGTKFGAGATAFFFLYYVFFGICWQGIPWLYPVEINSLAMRTRGAALGTASNWISNYLIVQTTPIGITKLGWKFYLIWASFNAAFVPLVWLFYPETSNRHLEDIDRLYRENQGMVLVIRNKEAIQTERPQRFVEATAPESEKD